MSLRERTPTWAKRLVPYAAASLVAAPVALRAVREIVAKSAHAAVPLDDAYIHFQYARRLAEGHFFSYSPGDGYTSGATSLVWPALLAPFWALGARDVSLAWGAWALCFAAWVALAVETFRLARPLTGRGAALGAAAMVLTFGGYVWCAFSGMEVLPLAWVLARTARLAADAGDEPDARTRSTSAQLALLGLVAPLVRPEGAMASALAAAALALFPAASAASRRRARLLALVPLLGPALLPALNLALTGHAASATTTVKWLVGNPYYGSWPSLVATVRANLATFFDTLLDGREWSAVFVPTGARPFAVAALLAIPLAGWSRGKRWRAGVVLIVALGMLVPCTYLSFLWNRLRYLWPFAFAWTVGFACAARLLGDLVALFSREGEKVAWLAAGFGAGALATHLSWTIDDLAGSASGIDRQQVALGRWAAAHLPADARIGVNDTGAVAYFSGRRTFDVVGLTTPGEARYWVAGAGARYEHYERLGRASRASLPTHFIVYPEWMACEPVLGAELHSETVTDQTILGGQTMTAYEASWRVLGAADRPEEPPAGEPLDELDVADLESEATHAYLVGTAVETDCVVLSTGEGERLRADGARVRRASDEATLALRPGAASTVVVRLASSAGATVDVEAEGERVATLELDETDWDERAIVVPARLASPRTRLRLVARDEGRFGVAHYWAYAGGATPLGDRAAGERPARPAAP